MNEPEKYSSVTYKLLRCDLIQYWAGMIYKSSSRWLTHIFLLQVISLLLQHMCALEEYLFFFFCAGYIIAGSAYIGERRIIAFTVICSHSIYLSAVLLMRSRYEWMLNNLKVYTWYKSLPFENSKLPIVQEPRQKLFIISQNGHTLFWFTRLVLIIISANKQTNSEA